MKVFSIVLLSLLCLICVNCGDGGGDADKIAALTGDSAKGKTVWQTCQGCHGADGKGVTGSGPDLTTSSIKGRSGVNLIGTILKGDGSMPSYKDTLSQQDIADVMAYIRNDLQK